MPEVVDMVALEAEARRVFGERFTLERGAVPGIVVLTLPCETEIRGRWDLLLRIMRGLQGVGRA